VLRFRVFRSEPTLSALFQSRLERTDKQREWYRDAGDGHIELEIRLNSDVGDSLW